MTDRDLMQQALDALELVTDLTNHDEEVYAAIDNLRERLAQPEQEPAQSEWDNIPQAFNNWWNADYDDSANPFRLNSSAYWAWAGWQAAQQPEQEPVVECDCKTEVSPDGQRKTKCGSGQMRRAVAEGHAFVEQAPQPVQQEPVAIVDANDEGYWAEILPDRSVKVGQLLYTAPPQRQPLTDEQEPEAQPAQAPTIAACIIGADSVGKKIDGHEAAKVYAAMQKAMRFEIVTTPQPAQQPKQEPVGQLQEAAYGRGQVMWFNKPADQTMLYTAPRPAQQPLTDERRRAIAKANIINDDHYDAWGIIEDVEAAHGIGEKK